MKLYYSAGACSLSPHIVLRELGQKFDLESVDLGAKKTKSGRDYTQINPKGYVPALELDNGETLTEGPAIVQFLADKAGAEQLLPKPGTMERYRAVEMLNFITSEIHKTMSALFNKAMPEEMRNETLDKISKRIDYLDSLLSRQKYLLGDHFTVADAYAFVCLSWGKWLNVDLSKWKNVSDFMGRVSERPAVKEAMAAEAA